MELQGVHEAAQLTSLGLGDSYDDAEVNRVLFVLNALDVGFGSKADLG